MPHQISQEVRQCIENCLDCYSICQETLTHCLELGGKHATPQHIRLLQDCSEICQTSAGFMLRTSNFHPKTCATCAEICEQCANECERMAEGDELMRRCAEMCHRCAESCRSMAMATV